MPSTFRQLREKATARDNRIHEARKAGLINTPRRVPLTVEQMQDKIQMLEAALTQNQYAAQYAQPLVVPRANGQVQSANEYQFSQRAQNIIPNIQQELQDFYAMLQAEPTEIVTNYDKYDFECSLNGVGYSIPGKKSKALPRTLAEHYRSKRLLDERNETFIQATGGVGVEEAHDYMPFPAFAREINSFDASGIADGQQRRYFF